MATKDKLINLEDMKAVRDHDMAIVDNKADQTGSYPDLIAGTAENLLPSSYNTNRTPYLLRRTPYGVREKGHIVGGSVTWNQLIENGDFANGSSKWVTNGGQTSFDANKCSFTIVNAVQTNALRQTKATIADHVYLASMTITPPKATTAAFYIGNSVVGTKDVTATRTTVNVLCKAANNGTYIYYYINRKTELAANDTCVFENMQAFDLTLMFGPTIADYIYTQEQATAGAGVTLAKAWAGITADYYPYDAGSIKSVTGLTAHKTTGFNQWDEEWEVGTISQSTGENADGSTRMRTKNYIPVIQGQTYYIRTAHQYGVFDGTLKFILYDSNKKFLEAPVTWYGGSGDTRFFTVPNGVSYIRFIGTASGTTGRGPSYIGDICINLSDPSKNGTYEPYTAHEYPLDSSLTLQGLPKLDGDNLYYDGDVYEGNKTGAITYATENMEDMPWFANGTSGGYYEYAVSIADKAVGQYNVFCDLFPTAVGAGQPNTIRGRSSTTTVSVLVAESSLEAFLSSVSGHKLCYELSSPMTQESGGTVTVHYALTDLGSINWLYNDNADNPYFYSSNVPNKLAGNWNILCNKYALSAAGFTAGMADKEIKGHTSKAIFIKDSAYTDAATFKASLAGVWLLYELDTPFTISASTYTELQICDPNGTEEWVGALMPVGHDTKYYADLKGKLEDIPDAPSADGTYTLKVTVSGGVATYSWE